MIILKPFTQKRRISMSVFTMVFVFIFFVLTSLNCLAEETEPDYVSVTLPSEIPFRIILPKNGGEGLVNSDEFMITNNGSDVVGIILEDVYADIADKVNFTLLDEEQLPEHSNGLYLELVCTQNGESLDYILSDTPEGTHSFWLESGESASFRINGVVSEYGDSKWSDTTVLISVRFAIEPVEREYSPKSAAIPDKSTAITELEPTAEQESEAEEEEIIADSDSGEKQEVETEEETVAESTSETEQEDQNEKNDDLSDDTDIENGEQDDTSEQTDVSESPEDNEVVNDPPSSEDGAEE